MGILSGIHHGKIFIKLNQVKINMYVYFYNNCLIVIVGESWDSSGASSEGEKRKLGMLQVREGRKLFQELNDRETVEGVSRQEERRKAGKR